MGSLLSEVHDLIMLSDNGWDGEIGVGGLLGLVCCSPQLLSGVGWNGVLVCVPVCSALAALLLSG
jgi:hypothetical protein